MYDIPRMFYPPYLCFLEAIPSILLEQLVHFSLAIFIILLLVLCQEIHDIILEGCLVALSLTLVHHFQSWPNASLLLY